MKNEKWNADNILSQKGRVAIVTGSSSGIGYETARVTKRSPKNYGLYRKN